MIAPNCSSAGKLILKVHQSERAVWTALVFSDTHLTFSRTTWIFLCVEFNKSVPSLLKSLVINMYNQSCRSLLWLTIRSLTASKNRLKTCKFNLAGKCSHFY